jgi:hypothetical protein
MPEVEHVIKVIHLQGSRQSWYHSECSCGEYRSKAFGYPGHAEQAGTDHKRAKESKA